MKKSISFSVTDEEMDYIRAYAEYQNRTPSNLAKYALQAFFRRYPLSKDVLLEKIDSGDYPVRGK